MKQALLYTVLGLVLATGAATLIWPQLSLFLASDSCIGAGGSFDFLRWRCDFKQLHAYVTFAVWPFLLSFSVSGIGLAMLGSGLLGLQLRNTFKPNALSGP